MQAGDNVEEAIADDQAVDSCSLLPEDAGPGPQVDGKGDQADWDVCKKVNSCLCHVHLGRGFFIVIDISLYIITFYCNFN